MITQKLDLNLIHGGVLPRVNVSQYDSGTRTLEIAVYNNTTRFTLLSSYAAFIQGTKPDNHGFQYSGTIDDVNNIVTFDITEQMTACFGDVTVELVITNGLDDRIATGNFIIAVEKAALSDTTIISDTELPLIEEAAEIAQQLPSIIATIEGYAETSEAYAIGEREGVPVSSDDPAFENNSKYYAGEAATDAGNANISAGNAATSESNAEAYAVGTRGGTPVSSGDVAFENNAKYYAGEAATSETNAGNSETNAATSASNAEAYGAGTRGGVPVTSGDAAFENNAAYYAGEASTDATAAGNSATSAATSAEDAEAWAVGEKNGTPVPSGAPQYENNAKYWSDLAAQYAQSFSGLVFKGSIAYASIPTTGMSNGDMYDINEAFVTDARFEEGSGVACPAGTDIVWVENDNLWNILTPAGVYSFNGRSGAIIPANNDYEASQIKFGVSSNVNTELGNKTPTYTADATAWDTTPTASSTKPVTSGGVNTALGNKLATYAADATAWDTSPTASSTKPVTSGGVNTALGNKLATYAADATAWDTSPTSASTKPVTSGGVYTAITNITPTVSTTDIGEGAALANNKIYIVVS